ncbi:hypothetical protein LTR10_000424 [Elasticomyces elasticus]|nr:hypothetical protein LTR10_000424 [Elasticomyces elasticus]KAK4980326.1 hypothetical protein LTR42_000633 [Elasticomyces elasticus]
MDDMPDSNSPDLGLAHPTEDECETIWTHTFEEWGDALILPIYLEESRYLTTVPLAKEGGMAIWTLVDKTLPPNKRPILASCESFGKLSLSSDPTGNTQEGIVHGIASVFCAPGFRRRGYAARLTSEMGKVLRTWQAEFGQPMGSILYSDIGKSYYAKLGWIPNSTNTHYVFSQSSPNVTWPSSAKPIMENLDHMLWHVKKEDFATQFIFGNSPTAKGAIAGHTGFQTWALWVHRYYGLPTTKDTENVLYILWFVVEGDEIANNPPAPQSEINLTETRQLDAIRLATITAVLQAAVSRQRTGS